MSFSNIDPDNPLFKELASNNPQWWQNLVNDPDIYVDIRKDNIINAYYRGASILSLEHSNGLSGKIHYEYIPLKSETTYVSYKFSENSIDYKNEEIRPYPLNNFDQNALNAIKKRVRLFQNKQTEKCIQSEFVIKDRFFIDSEFAYKRDLEEELRIDLVRIDTDLRKIVFYELKRISDPRLLDGEIVDQLKKYKDFINQYKEELFDHYTKLFKIKKRLNLLSSSLLEKVDNIDNYTILDKPVLLIGDCTDKWIENNKEFLNKRIKDHAYGCLYLGKATRNSFLPSKTSGNRYIYDI